MIIHIILDEPRTVNYVGDKITGIVFLQTRKPIFVHHVQVVFQGESNTVIRVTYRNGTRGTVTHHDSGSAPLFASQKILCVGPFTLEPGRYQWSFDFIVPTIADAPQHIDWGRPWGDSRDNPIFPNRAPQPLPPSCRVCASAANGMGAVFYGLRAELVGKPAFMSKKIKVRKTFIYPINFSPLRRVHKPEYQLARQVHGVTRRSYQVDPEKTNSLTFRESMYSMFKRSKVPIVGFIIAVHIPLIMVVGASPPIFVSLQVDPERSSVTKYPPVLIRKIHATIYMQTVIRTPVAWTGKHSGLVHGLLKHKLVRIKYKYPIPLEGRLDLRELVPNMRFPQHQPPTFTTYNIKRIYRLGIRLSISCANKRYRLNFEPEVVEVLPAKSVREHYRRSEDSVPDEMAPARYLQVWPPEVDISGNSSYGTSISGVSSTVSEMPPPAYTPRSVVV